MIGLFKKLLANRSLLKNLVLRDLKYRYVGSIAGFLWSVIHPLVSFVRYTFVFTVIVPTRLAPESGTDSFAIFFHCAFLHWLRFSDTVMRNVLAIPDYAHLITITII